MGLFSFITSDTNRSIRLAKPITVHVITEDRQIFTEREYEGYGRFGEMDIYSLIGYLNGLTGDNDTVRNKVFNELINGGITNGKKTYRHKKDFDNYGTPIADEGGKTANQLMEEGFVKIFPRFEFEEFFRTGITVPKIVQKLPKGYQYMTDEEWKKYFHSLPHTKNCPTQGIF